MKSHRLIFVLTLLFCWQSGIFAYHSDNFIIGTYTNLKPYPENTTFNSNILTLMRQQGKYNVSICENTLPAIESFSNAETMLQAHYTNEIDPWLCDYHTGYNDDGELISAGPYSLSTGNRWLFEAEFFDSGIPPEYYEDDLNSNKYFYQFSRDISNRIGYATVDRGNPGNRKVWACSPDTSGVILHGLRYRFPVTNAANASSSNYGVIGPEFRFT
ncbi:MAG: hypothetical protein GX294_02265 [Candidatus Cloacimonetes bacterium]|nr:hypothetical protein [Candidatus Cloacimonadota bacterium]